MLALVAALVCTQTPPQAALEALESRLVPSPRLVRIFDASPDVLVQQGWDRADAEALAAAHRWSSTQGILIGVALGVLLSAGNVMAMQLSRPTSTWVGAFSSAGGAGALVAALFLARGPATEAVGVLGRRTQRLLESARRAADWDPLVVDVTNSVLSVGVHDGAATYVEGAAALTDEAFEARVARTPPLAELLAESSANVARAIAFGVGAVLMFAAPPAIIGAAELPPLGDLAVVMGGSLGGLVLALVAQAFGNAAANVEAQVLDRYNAALVADARERLEARPTPRAPAPPAPVEAPPTPEAGVPP
jgi:hypothetical protein